MQLYAKGNFVDDKQAIMRMTIKRVIQTVNRNYVTGAILLQPIRQNGNKKALGAGKLHISYYFQVNELNYYTTFSAGQHSELLM